MLKGQEQKNLTEMKKILVLVASITNLPIIEAAKAKGCYVITCDNKPDNPGHKIADESIFIDVCEYDKIIQEVTGKNIDAVVSFVSSHGLLSAAMIANRFGLKGYAIETIETLTDKGKFREFLQKNSLTYPIFQYTDHFEKLHKEKIDYPVIVKPTGGGGSQGVTKVNTEAQLIDAFKKAQVLSDKGEVIVETFIESNRFINGDCLICDRKIVARLIGDYVYDNEVTEVVPIATVFPSADDTSGVLEQLSIIIERLNIPDGIINFEAIIKENKSYIVEINPRPSGNYIWKLLGHKYNMDIPGMLIDLYTNQGPGVDDFNEGDDNGYAYQLIYSSEEKVFDVFHVPKGMDQSILDLKLFVKTGDCIKKLNTLFDRAGLLLLRFEDNAEKIHYLDNTHKFKI